MTTGPDKLPLAEETPEERFADLGRRLFTADPKKLKERLAAEKEAREKANGGVKKRGRPRKTVP